MKIKNGLGVNLKIYVISNTSDKERSENIKKQFESQMTKFDYEIVEAVMNSNQPAVGILHSFKKCIELAKKAWFPEILILEDDFNLLTPTALADFIKIWDTETLNRGIFLGGLYEGNITYVKRLSTGLMTSYAMVSDKLAGLHSIVIPENLYDFILQAPEGYHLDYYLSQGHTIGYYTTPTQIYIAYPFLITQGNFPSANGNDMNQLNSTLHLKYKLINGQGN